MLNIKFGSSFKYNCAHDFVNPTNQPSKSNLANLCAVEHAAAGCRVHALSL